MTKSSYAEVVEIERRLDALLRNQIADAGFARTLREVRQQWSQAIWRVAQSFDASPLPSHDCELGLRLARRPTFVCGAARSGTTMLRDLLDGHPELVVIPNESGFYTWLEPALMRLRSDRQVSFLARHWLERLADPPPFWLLGRSGREGSPYVTFARDFADWSRVPERFSEARIHAWPLAAFALAYARWTGGGQVPAHARMWVEKTPGSERCLTRIWQDFPAAKVIQIVRRPEAVLTSIKALAGHRWTRRKTIAHILRQMAASYRIATRTARRVGEDRYCLVRYEDLVTDPEGVMRRIAGFLEITPLPSLLRPTTAGRPAFNNSSFSPSRPEARRELDPLDHALLKLAVGRHGAALGYGPHERSPAEAHRVVGGPPS